MAKNMIALWIMSLFGALAAAGNTQGPTVSKDAPEPLALVTYINIPYQEYSAAMWIDSVRTWAGEYRNCPIYVVLANPSISGMRLAGKKIEVIRLPLEESVRKYPYAAKAFAAAKVEEAVTGKFRSLAWFDPETLVFRPPAEMDLKNGITAAVNPVQLIGIGQGVEEPVDAFWAEIYRRFGLEEKKIFSVETVVDERRIRAYLNCGIFAVRPERGLFREWARQLDVLLHDELFQKILVTDTQHRTFLHQVVISTLLVSRLKREEMHFFSPSNGYPLFCHDLAFSTPRGSFRIPAAKKTQRLEDLTSVFHEVMWYQYEDWQDHLPPAAEPLKNWMTEEHRRYVRSLRVAENLYREENSCNSYLISTREGSVLIDPGGAAAPQSMLSLYNGNKPIKAILLTHAHEDHRTGIASWKKDPAVPVVGQREMVEFIRYHDRLSGFLGRRLAAQTGAPTPKAIETKVETPIEATVLYDQEYRYELAGIHFEMVHTGGETPDQGLIWVPEFQAVFIGDNYYTSFPNLYTLRGTKPRWALDYIQALEKALSLAPEILLPGHGEPVIGKEEVRRQLTEYRDAIRTVHDAVVEGMNQGKDVFTLMREVSLPAGSQIGQFYGRVSWSVRGIYEGYAGWFKEDPAEMYEKPAASVYPELVQLCGGSEAITARARQALQLGDSLSALHLANVVLSADSLHRPALEVRVSALKSLHEKSRNVIEKNWLSYGIRQAEEKLRR